MSKIYRITEKQAKVLVEHFNNKKPIKENDGSIFNKNAYKYHVTNPDYYIKGSITPDWDSEIILNMYGDDLLDDSGEISDEMSNYLSGIYQTYGTIDKSNFNPYVFFAEKPILTFYRLGVGNTVEVKKLIICACENGDLVKNNDDGKFPFFVERPDWLSEGNAYPDYTWFGEDAFNFFMENWPEEAKGYTFIH